MSIKLESLTCVHPTRISIVVDGVADDVMFFIM